MPLNPGASAFVPNVTAPIFIPGAPLFVDNTTHNASMPQPDKDAEASKLFLHIENPSADKPSSLKASPINVRMLEIHSYTPKGDPPPSSHMSKALPRIDSGRALDQLQAQTAADEDIFMDAPFLVTDTEGKSDSISPRDQWVEKEEKPQLIWSASIDAPPSSEGEASEDGNVKEEEEEEAIVEEVTETKERVSKSDSDASAEETVASEKITQKGVKATVDDFEILHMVGEGGFGKVYQVKKKSSGKVYAMKAMRKEVVIKENLRGTKAERSIMSSVRHPYIVNMHYAFQCKGRLYLIMDYFPGGQFLDMLVNHSPFEPEAYTLYTAEIMLALEELHSRSIVHRDLKPENILVDAQGHLVVTDFGCSKMPEEAGSPVRTRSWAGTELYMAPEQLQKEQYGQEVDWWALGALAWEMVTGDNPFYHKNRKVVHNNILKKKLVLPSFLPREVHALVKGLLHRDPAKRLGANGAGEVKSHPFFAKLDFESVLAKQIPAPLRSSAEVDNPLDVSAHNERYTKAAPCLSPLLSPMTKFDDHFMGFSWAADVDVLVLPPPQQAAIIAARRASRMGISNLGTQEERPEEEQRTEDEQDEEAVPPVLVKDEAKEEAKKEEDKKEEKKEEDDDGTTPASWEEEEEEDVGGGAELAAAVPISCSPVEGGVIQSSSLVTV